MSGIYQIKNRRNGRCYIGQSIDIHKRWEQHKEQLRWGQHHNYQLQADWLQDGEKRFKFSVVQRCPNWQLDMVEAVWIQRRGYYNIVRPRVCLLYKVVTDFWVYFTSVMAAAIVLVILT